MEQLEDNAAYYAKLHKKITKKSSTIIDKVISMGVAKDTKSASIVLSIVSVALFAASIFILVAYDAPGQPTYREDIPEHLKRSLSKEFLERFPSSSATSQQ